MPARASLIGKRDTKHRRDLARAVKINKKTATEIDFEVSGIEDALCWWFGLRGGISSS
jgi:hypothetical protein